MATLVFFHAHPDDESILTGGTMARAAGDGHRVVLVVATRGERGDVPGGFLDEGETLAERRVLETHRSAEILGISRVELLDYVDSGMAGDPGNDDLRSFWQADVEVAARHLADLLDEERADVLTTYDERGNYGHPDHIQVHRVGNRAGALAGTPAVFEATQNRDYIRMLLVEARARGISVGDDGGMPFDPETLDIGVPAEAITHAVEVVDLVDRKRASMRAHASQISEQSFFLNMADDVFALAFGTEWYTRVGATRPVAVLGDRLVD